MSGVRLERGSRARDLAAVRAELLKVRTVPGAVLGAAAAAVAHPLASLAVVGSGGVDDAADLVAISATGAVAGLLAWGVWAAVLAAGEHEHGTFAPGAVAVGGVVRLLVAKAVVIGGLAFLGSGLGALLALGLVRAALPPGSHDLGPVPALLVVPAVAAALALIAAIAGLLLRGSGPAVTLVAAVVLVPRAAGGLLGPLEPWIVGASPGAVVSRLVGQRAPEASQAFPAGGLAALGVLLGLALGAVVVAALRVRRPRSPG